jgi:hypothetical protein
MAADPKRPPREFTYQEMADWNRFFAPPGPIIRCEECGDDVTAYQRGKIVWCPRCNRNHI